MPWIPSRPYKGLDIKLLKAHNKAFKKVMDSRCPAVKKEILIRSKLDIPVARKELRRILNLLGQIRDSKEAMLLTILDEISKNILRHGKRGRVTIEALNKEGKTVVKIIGEDVGKGISDLDEALLPGSSEDGGLGMGLNLVFKLADQVRIASNITGGTYIEAIKWI